MKKTKVKKKIFRDLFKTGAVAACLTKEKPESHEVVRTCNLSTGRLRQT